MRYSAAFLGWSRLQLEEIDRRKRKLLTMHNGFHPKTKVVRLYLSTNEGSRRLLGVQDTVETAISGLRNYVRNSKTRLLFAAHIIKEDEDRETPNEYKKMKKKTKGKYSGHKNNYMDNLSGKQWVKQVKIGGDG